MTKYATPGEWDSEPDELDWTDDKTGLQCRLIRHRSLGHLCGYVQIPASHPLHAVSYNAELPESLKVFMESVKEGPTGKRGVMDLFCAALGGDVRAGFLFDVHGSVTFSGDLSKREGFWYGFDCGHCDDLSPGMSHRFSFDEGEYRNVEYVKAECASLAQQLHTLSA